MFKNYVKIALRFLITNKTFSFINIGGLAIGLTSFILIAAFLVDEVSYDQYPVQQRQIYRVGLQIAENGGIDDYPFVDVAVAEGMKNAFPEIIASARVFGSSDDFVSYKDVQFKEQHIAWADSNFLQLFSIPLIEGNEKEALTEPNSIVFFKTNPLQRLGG